MAGPPRVIPFYGAVDRRLFAVERRSMDRDGVVIQELNATLPVGRVLDVGAGDGFTAVRLARPDRPVVPLEPAAGMVDRGKPLPWVRGVAQALPFRDGAFAGAYATWAYFFPAMGHGDAGLAELHRVVAPGGPLVMVDNAGDDAFTALASPDADRLGSDAAWWQERGFARRVVETAFRFDSVEEAQELLGFYFGEAGARYPGTEVGYRVAVFVGRSRGARAPTRNGPHPGPTAIPLP